MGAPNRLGHKEERPGASFLPWTLNLGGCRALFLLWNVFHEIFWALPVPGTSQGQQCHPGKVPKPGQHSMGPGPHFFPFQCSMALYPRSPGTHTNVLSWDLMAGSWFWRTASCYKLNVYVPPKLTCWNLIPSVMVFGDRAFGMWLGHNGGTLTNRISILIKDSPESCLAPSTLWGQRKDSHLWNKKWSSPHTKSAAP